MFFLILSYDIWFYISHIILHNKFAHFIHKIHHQKHYTQLYFLDTYKSHYIENIIQPIGILFPFIIVKFSLLEVLIAVVFICIRGIMRHDHRCSWLIGNHHILHHKYANNNYGEYWIDKLCGTQYPNSNEYIYGYLYT